MSKGTPSWVVVKRQHTSAADAVDETHITSKERLCFLWIWQDRSHAHLQLEQEIPPTQSLSKFREGIQRRRLSATRDSHVRHHRHRWTTWFEREPSIV